MSYPCDLDSDKVFCAGLSPSRAAVVIVSRLTSRPKAAGEGPVAVFKALAWEASGSVGIACTPCWIWERRLGFPDSEDGPGCEELASLKAEVGTCRAIDSGGRPLSTCPLVGKVASTDVQLDVGISG